MQPTTTTQTWRLLLVGGVFDTEGGRPSGYFGKLAEALMAALPGVPAEVLNGGSYAKLADTVHAAQGVTHLLWFADVPNELPKLLPAFKERYPQLVLVASKNNRSGRYDRPALFARMAAAGSSLLVEFANGSKAEDSLGQLVASILTAQRAVVLEASPSVGTVARCLAQEFEQLAQASSASTEAA